MIFEDDETLTSHPGSDPALADEERRMSLLIYHRNGVEVVPLVSGQPLTIGRLLPADIVINDNSLSRQHAVVELLDDEVWIQDLKSTNGTRINGTKIKRARMKIADELMMGHVTLSLHVMTPMEGQLHGLDSNDRFHSLMEEEITRAKTFGRKLALIMIRAAPRHQGKLNRWCPRIRQLLRPVDRIGLYSPDVVEILLPEFDLQQAKSLAHRMVVDRQPDEPPLLCGLVIYPDAGSSAEELIELGRTTMKQARLKQPIQALGMDDPHSSTSLGTDEQHAVSDLVIKSPAMLELNNMVERLAGSTIPVLILGETGAGKEVIARSIHRRSKRGAKPMRCINCGAIPEHLIESVLFGHERGAFTGADRRFCGAFEEADGGCVFLDEIGELVLQSQVALLRVLDTKQITRVGSNQEIKVDVRIIAATHQDLHAMCKAGTFRQDLFYRLNTMVLRVPPLRERPEEIQPLADNFIRNANETDGCNVRGFEPQALELLRGYHWPGNVRELRNVIDRAVVIARGELISVEDLPERLQHSKKVAQPRARRRTQEVTTLTSVEEIERRRIEERLAQTQPAQTQPAGTARAETDRAEADRAEADRAEQDRAEQDRAEQELDADPATTLQPQIDFKTMVQRYEVGLIRDALRWANGNQTQAAQRLGIARRTLLYKMNALGIDRHQADEGETFDIAARELFDAQFEKQHDEGLDLKSRMDRYEVKLLRQALERADGNQAEAAQLLGVPKHTVANKIAKYGLK